MVDDLRRDVIRAIADGSKISRALLRAVADLPFAHYGSEPYADH